MGLLDIFNKAKKTRVKLKRLPDGKEVEVDGYAFDDLPGVVIHESLGVDGYSLTHAETGLVINRLSYRDPEALYKAAKEVYKRGFDFSRDQDSLYQVAAKADKDLQNAMSRLLWAEDDIGWDKDDHLSDQGLGMG